MFLSPLLLNHTGEHRARVIWNALLAPEESKELMPHAQNLTRAFLVFQKSPQYRVHTWSIKWQGIDILIMSST